MRENYQSRELKQRTVRLRYWLRSPYPCGAVKTRFRAAANGTHSASKPFDANQLYKRRSLIRSALLPEE